MWILLCVLGSQRNGFLKLFFFDLVFAALEVTKEVEEEVTEEVTKMFAAFIGSDIGSSHWVKVFATKVCRFIYWN